ncbi:MAG: hypothetical protein QM660_06380 [Dysgonomonas sp.]
MKQNEVTPLEALRREKEILRGECREGEDRLAGHWNYVSNNIGSLLFSSAISSIRNKLGFGSSSSKTEDNEDETSSNSSHGVLKGVLGGLLAASPFLWEMLQPMIMNYAMTKFKSMFSKKKKKKKKKSSDDDDDD